jgi:D-alanine-D-alanine ligase
MRRLRVLLAAHAELVPPARAARETKERADWRTEYDLARALRGLGHELHILGVQGDIEALGRACRELRPHVVVNQLVEFHGTGAYDQHVASYLELLRQPYTGCNPRGLTLARDKALSKALLACQGIRVPRFALFPRAAAPRPPRGLPYPLLVKAQSEEASLGIAQASLVRDEGELLARVRFLHRTFDVDVIGEEFVPGRELTVGLLGHCRPLVLPPWELIFRRLPRRSANIATRRAKWDRDYQRRVGLVTRRARALGSALELELARTARAVHRTLGLSGYARVDFRLRPDGQLFVLEANPNPDLAREDDLSAAAAAWGLSYPRLVQRVLELALSYPADWRRS